MVQQNTTLVKPYTFAKEKTLQGVDFAQTFSVTKRVGITADASVSVGTSVHDKVLLTLMGGPRYSFKNSSRVTPFVRALGGLGYFRSPSLFGTKGDGAFAYSVGGGIDVKASKSISLRLIQLDYLRTNVFNQGQNNVRIGAGVVF